MWTIRQNGDDSWDVLSGDALVESFTTYNAALAFLSEHIAAELATLAAENADTDGDGEADGLLSERWVSSPAIAYSQETGDGRNFESCTWSARDPNVSLLPLMLQTETEMGHFGAVLAGYIETIDNLGAGTNPTAAGRFYDTDSGRAARDLLLGDRSFGVSVDPGSVDAEFTCVEEDEDGWCVEARVDFTAYEIIGLTMTPFPAFAEASIVLDAAGEASQQQRSTSQLAAVHELAMVSDHEFSDGGDGYCDECVETGEDDECLRICGAVESQHVDTEDEDEGESAASVAASATLIPVRPPAEWFALPEPQIGQSGMLDVYGMPVDELLIEQQGGNFAVPLTILDDGRVFGHIAAAGTCHTGFPGQCVTPPESEANYAHFHVGEVVCSNGERMPTGALVAGCDHAVTTLRASEARDHYAHNGVAWADVRIVEGEHGPWACGALRPDVTEQQMRVLRAGALSGDWRRLGGSLELISVLAVNAPGFPITRRAIVASGLPAASLPQVRARVSSDVTGELSLIASGVVTRCRECQRRATEDAQLVTGERTVARLDVQLDTLSRRLLAALDGRLDTIDETLARLDSRTRHLRADAAESLRQRMAASKR